ncbi:MAG: protoporphyrinogen oxidase, partial [Acidobacteriota bacterium]
MQEHDIPPPTTVVVGAGLAGLTAAFRLRAAGRAVRVVEAAERVGGTVRSVLVDGHRFEHGPTTVPSTAPHLARLIDDAGLRPRAQLSRSIAGRRLVWRRGRLHALPEKPPQLLACSALGPFAKLRLLAEPWIPARRDGADETLLDFGVRRLGRGAVDAFLDPFVTGIHAGRLDRLGVDALPRLATLEREHGSLIRGAIALRKARPKDTDQPSGPPPLVSFADGMEALPRGLAAQLNGVIEIGRRATHITPMATGYRVELADDASIDADA